MSGEILRKISNLQSRVSNISRGIIGRSGTGYRSYSIQPKYTYKMNEAYLRYNSGDSTFQFTFRYINAELNVDRQFHMVRKPDENVASFLRRLDGNIEKILSRKKKRKVKKGATTEAEEEIGEKDRVRSGEISLERNESKIAPEELCESLFRDTSQITLRIMGVAYKMRLNVPWILKMSLPTSILAGFATYPSDFQTIYADRSKSLFTWYINRSRATQASGVYQSSWEPAGEGFVYTPGAGDADCRLKLRCEPLNENERGPAAEVESENRIQAGPGDCPFQTRHSFTRDKTSADNFRIVSYNILADVYASTDYARDVLFPYCPAHALSMDYRKQLIIKELVGYNSDIICLQEVDRKVFENDLLPIFSLLGYNGIHNRKGDDLSEGVAIFYDETRFEKIASDSRVMSQNVDAPGFASVWKNIDNERVKERFLGRNTTVQALVLRSNDRTDEFIVVGNTHLYFQPDADHIRLLQGFYALSYIENIARQTRQSFDNDSRVSLVLAGDFNSTPDCAIYQLMTTGHVPETHKDWKSNAEQSIEKVSLSHDHSFGSACGTPRYTNFTAEFADCLDYIFYQTDNMRVTRVVPFPSTEELSLNRAIPSVVFPSDHVALCADFQWKPRNKRA